MGLKLDYTNILEKTIGEAGISNGEIEQNLNLIQKVYAEIQSDKKAGSLGFAELPYKRDSLEEIAKLADEVKKSCDSLIVIGIGGSDLGARAVHRALNHQFYNQVLEARKGCPKIYFVGDTTDSVALQEVLDAVDLSKTVLVVISKSGDTIEPMSAFIYLRQKLLETVGQQLLSERIIAITDAKKGTLREIAELEGYRTLPMPNDVGGRFSVLSPVGLFPLAVVGIDVEGLLDGARYLDESDNMSFDVRQNMVAYYTYLLYLSYTRKHQTIRVLMPYSYSLREVGYWYRQLWAESLGKSLRLDGSAAGIGPTPIAALGPTDQHSQLQLYLEGPINKLITFITVDEPILHQREDYSMREMTIPSSFDQIEGVSYLKGHTFDSILKAEQKSTAYALAQAGRPSCHIQMERLDSFNLGQLLYFFELAVTYAGKLHRINPFDQPAVEIGKRYMYNQIGRDGFAEYEIKASSDSINELTI